ncbi:MAG: hypothetical protein IPH28_21125 [Cytophagaceae bacterium]|nr:hypothetical protein [Cytophagaceae bacterium]
MIKRILKIFSIILLLLIAFSFWISPRLGGLLDFGKESIDKEVFQLEFDSSATGKYELVYEVNSKGKIW